MPHLIVTNFFRPISPNPKSCIRLFGAIFHLCCKVFLFFPPSTFSPPIRSREEVAAHIINLSSLPPRHTQEVGLRWRQWSFCDQTGLWVPSRFCPRHASPLIKECCAVSMCVSHKHAQSGCHMFGSAWRDTARLKTPRLRSIRRGTSTPSSAPLNAQSTMTSTQRCPGTTFKKLSTQQKV